MADFIISPYAISFNSIKNALETYISNKSEVTSTWSDFYTAGAGQTVLELDAAIGAFYAFHFIIGRREAYLTTAQNYSSVVGSALGLGYSCSRGHNVYFSATIIPSATQTLSKWTVVGSYGDYDVVLIEDAILNKGVETVLKCVVGNSQAQQLTITSSDLQQFTFTADNTSDDYRLILNSTEVPVSTEIKDAIDDYYVTITNPYGSMDVFYLNNGKYNYKSFDVLYLQYIETNSVTFGSLSTSSINIDYASDIIDLTCIEDHIDKESIEHIKICAPLYHETNNVVRARKDYVKFLLENNSTLIDANDKDINPGLIALTYLKEEVDGISLMTEEEKEDYVALMMTICPDGVAKAFIEDPIRVIRTLDIRLWQRADENMTASLETDINEILASYENTLAPKLDFEQIEHDIEQLTGVKIARVDFGTVNYTPNTKYKLYDIINVDVLVGTEVETWTFYCGYVNTTSGSDVPDWAANSEVGDTVVDNNLIWKRSDAYANSITVVWNPDGSYELYNDINVSYTVGANCTLATEPSWNYISQSDGNVTWNRVYDFEQVISNYKTATKYTKGISTIVSSDNNLAIYTVTDVSYKSGSTAPNWNSVDIDETLVDNALTWTCKYDTWQPNTNYAEANYVGSVYNGVLYIYQVSSVDGEIGTSGSSNPLTGAETVVENEITWNLRETITDYTSWTANTEIAKGMYVNGSDRYFVVTNINNTLSGTDTVFYDNGWKQTVEDNNVVWELQTYEFGNIEYPCTGVKWQPLTEFSVDDKIICSSSTSTYVYQCIFSSDVAQEVSNLIYTVSGYAGTTGEEEPEWGDDNVIDNEILWTITTNPSNIEWEANTVKQLGDIITTSAGYYTFSSVLGTSGSTDPDWAGIKNNQVQDNNITWIRITDSNILELQWNEYLKLTVNSINIVG